MTRGFPSLETESRRVLLSRCGTTHTEGDDDDDDVVAVVKASGQSSDE